jgi:hypothetical protein
VEEVAIQRKLGWGLDVGVIIGGRLENRGEVQVAVITIGYGEDGRVLGQGVVGVEGKVERFGLEILARRRSRGRIIA